MKVYNNVYWVSVSASAHYSGNSVQDGIFVSKELWDLVDTEDLGTVYYHELDGKHSECEATTGIVLVTEDNAVEVLLEWKESNGEDWIIFESLLYGQDDGLIEKITAFHEEFSENVEFTTTIKCKFGDQELTLQGE